MRRTHGDRYDVATADSGAEALETIVRRGPFDIVVSDFRMPKMNGFEFITRAGPLAPNARFLLLTGDIDPATERLAATEPAISAVLPKPCSRATLAEAIETALSAAPTVADG